MKNNKFSILKKLLFEKKNIVILPHSNPDGDAVGSCLALMELLKLYGHKTTVISPNHPPDFLKWVPGFNEIVYYDNNEDLSRTEIENADLIFTLDFNNLSRIGELEKIVIISNATIVMIDHHQNPENYADLIFSDPEISSTCELLYKIILKLGYEKNINSKISSCLYLGIMTDTGSFQYPNVTSETHKIVSKLIDHNINQSEIYNKVYNNSSTSKLKVLGIALNNLIIIKELKTTYMFLTREDLKMCNFKKGDSEGIVNYGLTLKNIIFSVIFIEDIEHENKIKISFRSHGSFSCNEFAKKYFNGGGHTNAAGGFHKGPINEVINKFTKSINNYKVKLTEK